MNARKDTCSREVLRHEDLKELVKLERIRDHFICKIHISNKLDVDSTISSYNKINITLILNTILIYVVAKQE